MNSTSFVGIILILCCLINVTVQQCVVYNGCENCTANPNCGWCSGPQICLPLRSSEYSFGNYTVYGEGWSECKYISLPYQGVWVVEDNATQSQVCGQHTDNCTSCLASSDCGFCQNSLFGLCVFNTVEFFCKGGGGNWNNATNCNFPTDECTGLNCTDCIKNPQCSMCKDDLGIYEICRKTPDQNSRDDFDFGCRMQMMVGVVFRNGSDETCVATYTSRPPQTTESAGASFSSPNLISTQPSDEAKLFALIFLFIFLLCIILLVAWLVYNRKKIRDRFLSKKGEKIEEHKQPDNVDMHTVAIIRGNSITNLRSSDNLTSESAKISDPITIKNLLGAGHYGEVYRGEWLKTEVALKKLKEETAVNFEREAKVLKKLNFPHIVRYLGLYQDPKDKQYYIVMEYLKLGALDSYLTKHGKELNLKQLVGMARDIAAGLLYLTDHNIVHRDIALRNVLVEEREKQLRCKVSDFGMARIIATSSDYYTSSSAQIPVRWSAPESLEYAKFTIASDVWSFGVLLWELFSLGQMPYRELESNQAIMTAILEGKRLDQPFLASDDIYEKMQKCWSKEPAKRPSFGELLEFFTKKFETTEETSLESNPVLTNSRAANIDPYSNPYVK